MTTKREQSVGEALGAIAARNGGKLTPDLVVDEAAKKTSPLHSHFEWSEKEAARKYRLVQAGALIRRVKVIYPPESENQVVKVRAFVNIHPEDTEGRKGVYIPVEDAMGDPEMRNQVIQNAKRDAAAFRQKYATLEEMKRVIAAIDETIS